MPRKKRNPTRHPNPPKDLARRALPLLVTQAPWVRIHQLAFDPIFFGVNGGNRFDAPDGEYAVLYVAQDMFGAFMETMGHDTGTREIALTLLEKRGLAEIQSRRALQLVDLTGPGLTQIGADDRLCSGPIAMAQRWSLALFSHPAQPDGICYRSRHDPARVCAAIFDRTRSFLTAGSLGGLTDAGQMTRLGQLLDEYKFGLR